MADGTDPAARDGDPTPRDDPLAPRPTDPPADPTAPAAATVGNGSDMDTAAGGGTAVGPAGRGRPRGLGGEAVEPPPRPVTMTAAELDFVPQPATRWYNPDVIVASGARHVLTSVFGSFLDKRELQANIPAEPDRRFEHRPDLWLDYIADTGDGFTSTYSMASLLARRELQPDGCETPLPRGEVLVLGGDEAYPAATTDNYEQRLSGPFRAALPWTTGRHPTLYALPGNHDWYDGLTGFLRLFGQRRWIGGWTTRQTRSYFAVQLPHRWWLWGMDIQADQFVDEPQLRFFADVLESSSRPGDRLVLAVPEPSWIDTEEGPDAYRNIAYLERTLLRPHGVHLEVVVAGNLHHYNRFTVVAPGYGDGDRDGGGGEGGSPTGVDNPVHDAVEPAGTMPVDRPDAQARRPRHLLTAGGGGAFLHPTHDLPSAIEVPADPGRPRPCQRYELRARYPSARRSWQLAWAALLLPVRNPGFLWVGAAVHVAVLWTNQFGLRSLDGTRTLSYASSAQETGWQDMTFGLFRNPVGGVSLALVALGLILLARRPPWARRPSIAWLTRSGLGLTHAAAQIAGLVLVAMLAVRLASGLDNDAWFVVATNALVAVGGGVVTAVVLGGYFAVANSVPALRVHGNEAFSAARLARHRSFLRLHVRTDGHLDIYVVGVERMVRRWRTDPTPGDPERPWLVPTEAPLQTHLVEHLTVPPTPILDGGGRPATATVETSRRDG